MQVFIYEFVTGGGMIESGSDSSLDSSLVREGRAMSLALVEDSVANKEISVVTTRDRRLANDLTSNCRVYTVSSARQERHLFHQLASESHWTLVVAPELGGALVDRSRRVQRANGRLLSADVATVRTGSDKSLTAELWARNRVRCPIGKTVKADQPFPSSIGVPCIVKPLDGAGSIGVRRLERIDQIRDVPRIAPVRVEPFVPGTPVSASVLCGSEHRVYLPAFRQNLRRDFSYGGGQLVVETRLQARAMNLAKRASSIVDTSKGFISIDMILGEQEDGSGDHAIELNPRVTTSYVGLRQAVDANLVGTMIRLAEGIIVPSPKTIARSLSFDIDGNVRRNLV